MSLTETEYRASVEKGHKNIPRLGSVVCSIKQKKKDEVKKKKFGHASQELNGHTLL